MVSKYIGTKNGMLNVIDNISKNNHTYLVCKCDCGKFINIRVDCFMKRTDLSCGCLKNKPNSLNKIKPIKESKDISISQEYYKKLKSTWYRIKQRCFNPYHHKFHSYGARGITVCDEWNRSFNSFAIWSLNNGFDMNLSIDRIDNNGNYEPSNCRWTTTKSQQRNRRVTLFYTYKGIKKSIAEWCEIYNLPYDATKERLKHNWDLEQCMSIPVKTYKSVKKKS